MGYTAGNRAVKLPWIFPVAPLMFNGASGNIQGNCAGMRQMNIFLLPKKQQHSVQIYYTNTTFNRSLDVMTWKCFAHYWPFVMGIQLYSPKNASNVDHFWFVALKFFLTNNPYAGDLRRHDARVTNNNALLPCNLIAGYVKFLHYCPIVTEQLNRKRFFVGFIRHRWVHLKQEDKCSETSSLFQSHGVQNAISIYSILFAVLPSEACLTGYSSSHRPASTTKIFGDHYIDVIMGAMASQITSLAIIYSTVYSDVQQRKHQSSASLAFVWGIHRSPVNSPHKGPVTRKMFPFDDVIMITLDFTRFVFLLPYHQFSGDQCHPFPHTHQCCVSVYHCIDREKQVAVHYFALNMIIVCEDNG